MSALEDLTRAFQLRLAVSPPTGYTASDIVNIDRGSEETISGKHLVQRTQLGLRQFTARDVKRCVRQYYIHTIGIYVPFSDRLDRAGILSTANEIQALFEKVEFDMFKTQEAALDVFGRASDSKFYRVDVNINGYYEEILS